MKPLYLPTICRPFWPWFSLLIEQLIAQLDDDQFKVREKATAELNRIGERIVPALDAALAKERPLESSNRLHGLRTKMIGAVLEGERPAHLQSGGSPRANRHAGSPAVAENNGGGGAGGHVDNGGSGSAEEVNAQICRPFRGLVNGVAAFFPRLAPWATVWCRYRGWRDILANAQPRSGGTR